MNTPRSLLAPRVSRFHPASPSLLLCIVAIVVGLSSCTSTPPREVLKGEKPAFKPEVFFAGRTRSWGVFEDRGGQPTKLIYTTTSGRWDGSVLHFEQDIVIPAGKNSHRSWLIRRMDAHHYTITGTGIIGTAQGETSGNAFHLDFTLDADPGNPLAHLHMSQWMYLQPDGMSMINRDTLTKAGIVVVEATEQFRKEK